MVFDRARLKLFFLAILCVAVLLACTLWHFPFMGHDYSLIIPALTDLKVAWKEFGVLNPQFSPMKCLGTPLWANPTGLNLSLLHFFVLIFNELGGLVFFIGLIAILSFYGAYYLARHFGANERWSAYLATGWTLQGAMFVRVTVGHISYINLGLFPLILFLFLRKGSRQSFVLEIVTISFLLSQFIYNPAPYLVIFFPMGLLACLPLMAIWKDERIKSLLNRSTLIKVSLISLLTLLLTFDKLRAVSDLMKSFPRKMDLLELSPLKVLGYAVLNPLSFWPHDFQKMVGWWYGNWESIQYLFPGLILVSLILILSRKDYKKLIQLSLSYLFIVSLTLILTSGILAPLIKDIPFLNSMHANPRWNMVTLLPMFYLAIALVRELADVKQWIIYSLLAVALFSPSLHIDKQNFGIRYYFLGSYDFARNRLAYCYEPFFGYGLEAFPNPNGFKTDFLNGEFYDPRCYLQSRNCLPGTQLKPVEKEKLRTYHLR